MLEAIVGILKIVLSNKSVADKNFDDFIEGLRNFCRDKDNRAALAAYLEGPEFKRDILYKTKRDIRQFQRRLDAVLEAAAGSPVSERDTEAAPEQCAHEADGPLISSSMQEKSHAESPLKFVHPTYNDNDLFKPAESSSPADAAANSSVDDVATDTSPPKISQWISFFHQPIAASESSYAPVADTTAERPVESLRPRQIILNQYLEPPPSPGIDDNLYPFLEDVYLNFALPQKPTPKAAVGHDTRLHARALLDTAVAPNEEGSMEAARSLEAFDRIVNYYLEQTVALSRSDKIALHALKSDLQTLHEDMLEVDAIFLGSSDARDCLPGYSYQQAIRGEFDYSPNIEALIRKKLDGWRSSHPKRLLGINGFRHREGGHAAYFEVFEKDGRYYRADFNAGDESRRAFSSNNDAVYSVDVREISCRGKNIEIILRKMLQLSYERNVRGSTSQAHAKLVAEKNRLEEEYYPSRQRVESLCHISRKQRKGNCAMRSVLEILRFKLPAPLFKDLNAFMTRLAEAVPQCIRFK